MEIAIISKGDTETKKLVSLIEACSYKAQIKLLTMDEPIYHPLPCGLDMAFVLADDLGAALTLEKMRIRAPNLPIVLISRCPGFALEGIRQKISDYLIWPLNPGDLCKTFGRLCKEDSSLVNA